MGNPKGTFLSAQYGYLFRTLPRKSLWHWFQFPRECIELPINYARLERALHQPAPSFRFPGKTCVVVLLSHNRPHNLDIIVRGALKNDFVRKVVVSNSNRDVHIREWISVSDPRLTLVDETVPTKPGHRFVLAEREEGDCFLSVDDDIFFTPRQWAAFFEHLVSDEEVPHGVTGNVYRPGQLSSNGSPFHHVSGVEQEVDVLIGAYAFTRKHLERLFALAKTLELGPVSNIGNGEDVLLSVAGSDPARIHDLGELFCCASAGLPGVALWQTLDKFWDERVSLFERARAARLAMGGSSNLWK